MSKPSSPSPHNPPSSQPNSSKGTRAEDSSRISRRDFGRHAVLAAALPFSPLQLLTSVADSERPGPTGTALQSHDAGALTAEVASQIESKLANIIRKYGNRLSAAQREHLRRILAYNEKMLASIRAFPLHNGDAPASVLKISSLEQAESSAKHAVARGGIPRRFASREEREV